MSEREVEVEVEKVSPANSNPSSHLSCSSSCRCDKAGAPGRPRAGIRQSSPARWRRARRSSSTTKGPSFGRFVCRVFFFFPFPFPLTRRERQRESSLFFRFALLCFFSLLSLQELFPSSSFSQWRPRLLLCDRPGVSRHRVLEISRVEHLGHERERGRKVFALLVALAENFNGKPAQRPLAPGARPRGRGARARLQGIPR